MTNNPLDRNHDTEDASYWYKLGVAEEHQFCSQVAPHVGLKVSINPEKLAGNKYAIDLILEENGALIETDLKVQRTPFFTATRYGKNPQLSITFNVKDLARYEEKYPEAHIVFYVKWETLEYRGVSIEPVEGIWRTTVRDIRNLVNSGRAPIHSYQKRINDEVNAKNSYVISLNDLSLVHCFTA